MMAARRRDDCAVDSRRRGEGQEGGKESAPKNCCTMGSQESFSKAIDCIFHDSYIRKKVVLTLDE